jgi:hypothetical protein
VCDDAEVADVCLVHARIVSAASGRGFAVELRTS